MPERTMSRPAQLSAEPRYPANQKDILDDSRRGDDHENDVDGAHLDFFMLTSV